MGCILLHAAVKLHLRTSEYVHMCDNGLQSLFVITVLYVSSLITHDWLSEESVM